LVRVSHPFLILQIRSHRMRTKPRAHMAVAYSHVILVNFCIPFIENYRDEWKQNFGGIYGLRTYDSSAKGKKKHNMKKYTKGDGKHGIMLDGIKMIQSIM